MKLLIIAHGDCSTITQLGSERVNKFSKQVNDALNYLLGDDIKTSFIILPGIEKVTTYQIE